LYILDIFGEKAGFKVIENTWSFLTNPIGPPMVSLSAAAVKKARESSLQVKGERLYNLLPKDIGKHEKNHTGNYLHTCGIWSLKPAGFQF
jgi:hypothetical protein